MSDVQSSRSSSESPVIIDKPSQDTTPVAKTAEETKAPPVTTTTASPVKAAVADEKAQFEKKSPAPTVEKKIDLMDLFRWKKPVNSAVVFASGLTGYYYFCIQGYTLITLVSYVLIGNILLNGSIFLAAKSLKYFGVMDDSTDPSKYYKFITDLFKGVLASDAFINVQENCMRLVTEQELKIKDAMTISEGPRTTQTIISLWLISLVGRMFSLSTIVLFAFISAFTVPTVYKKYGKEIDAFRASTTKTVSKTINDVGDNLVKSAPKLEPVLVHLGLRSVVKTKSE